MIGSNQGLLQEIYLFLEYDPDSSNIEKVAAIFEPFPVTVCTPSTTYHHPSHDVEDVWNLWRLRGIFSSEIRGNGVANMSSPVDADDNSMKSTGGSATSSNASDGTNEYRNPSEGGGSKEDRGGNSSDDNGGEDQNDDDDDDDGTIDNLSSAARRIGQDTCNTHEVSIPFSSTLTVSGGSHQQCARYKTNASVDITIERNLESQSRPPGLNWGGPWLEAKFSFLDAEIHVLPRGNLMFHLGLSQIRIIASGCPSSVLSYSPTILRADGNTVKSTTEKNNSTNLKATIGAAPTLQLGGTAAQSSSEERSQRRWEVVAHCLNSDSDEITGTSRTTMMWKYVHNDKYYSPETRNVFEPRPSTVFGLSRQSPTMPKLDIEVVTCYSWTTPVQRFRDWIAAARIKQKKVFPAFTNFLHQVSVTLDLTNVTERTEWVVGLNAEDRKKMSDIGKMSQPMLRRLESNIGASSCTVRLRRALHGHISLTEEQRKEFKTDPHSLLATAWPDEPDDTLASESLPTPSPSPSPTWPSG
ncbi:hypothetical protein BDZ94DRAFT_1255906 [Collybia nuda]|uniref:Uncharacterized protein n=1 Tax=Collybia nuda TaxID=64659 RepID=A0A9P6CJN6_9AGAR|nr:hypothetical protein BDZ94DRAFT_1255906 [Collybia nuda]